MSVSALRVVIGVFHRNVSVTINALSVAFTSDYGHFARANNREPLNRAVESLNKSKADKAIAAAITEGYKAGGLTVGYIGARDGALSKQNPDIVAQYEDAIVKASEAFTASLLAAEVFAPKAEKTEEEKALAKAKAKAKAEEAIAKVINEKVQAGELFHADSVGAAVTLGELSTLALIDELAHRNLTEAEAGHLDECFGLDLSRSSLIEAQRMEQEARAEAATLAVELEAVKVELEAAKTAKTKAAKAAKTAKTTKAAKTEAAKTEATKTEAA